MSLRSNTTVAKLAAFTENANCVGLLASRLMRGCNCSPMAGAFLSSRVPVISPFFIAYLVTVVDNE